MLTFNQSGRAIEWDALGRTYKWDGFGSCEVPDELFEHIKLEGLPVDLAPVPPKAKADAAVAAEQDAARADSVKKLQKELELAKDEAAEAKSAAAAAEKKATAAVAQAEAMTAQVDTLSRQLAQEKHDSAELEKIAAKATAELEELKQKRRPGRPRKVE